MICDEDVQCYSNNLRCGMYSLLCVVLCSVGSSDILFAMNWVFIQSFSVWSLIGCYVVL